MEAAPGILRRIFMNPLALREVRQACRSWKLVVFLSVYLLIQAAIYSIWIFVESRDGLFIDPTSIGSKLFVTMSAVLVAVVMLVFPAFSSTAIASEHEKKSFDLLLLTPLSPWEIALGKFFAAGLQASVFLIATVPLFAMASLFGGIDPAVFFVTLWVLILLSVLISFIGVYASSLVTRSIPAVLVTYLFAMLFGLVLLIVMIALAAASAFATRAFPLIGFLTDPTLGEGVYYVLSLTITCALYCTFLFLSTTNRLKPTSHNKSTNLRIFWAAVMVIVPGQFGAYFLIARLSSYGVTYGTLVVGAVYLTLLMAVPALSFAAEPPIASRRVRREMERAPAPLLNAGGSLFFPGSLRGAIHASIIAVLGMGLFVLAAWFCFGALEDRNASRTHLVADYRAVAGGAATSTPSGIAPTAVMPASAMPAPELMRAEIATYYKWDFAGIILMCLALLVTVLVCVQVTWRFSLSGLSRGISSVLAALIVVVWLMVPYLAEKIGRSEPLPENQYVAQFSPIVGAIMGSQWGEESGRAAVRGPELGYENRADRLLSRWSTFMIAGCVLGFCLLASNLVSHRRVMRTFKAAKQQTQQPPPPAPPVAAPDLPPAAAIATAPGGPTA